MKRGNQLIDDINRYHPPRGEAAFWWIGQHSFIIKIAETVCYVDPYLFDSPDRQIPPLLKPSEVTNATLVLGTHDHGDHIDRPSLPGVLQASPNAKLIVPQLLRDRLIDDLKLDGARVLGIDVDLPIEIAGLAINAVPAAHEFLDRDPKTGLHPFLGFVVQGNEFCFYHAGDTCIYEGIHAILRRWPIDLAFLPINGRDAHRFKNHIIGNMTYQEAADLLGGLDVKLSVPAHYDMFDGNREDPQKFVDYVKVKYPDRQVWVGKPTEKVAF